MNVDFHSFIGAPPAFLSLLSASTPPLLFPTSTSPPTMTPSPSLLKSRYRLGKSFSSSGGMGLLYLAEDTFAANNTVLIKTNRYDVGNRKHRFSYTHDEAIKTIDEARKGLLWEHKMLARFAKEALPHIPSITDFFYDRSITLQEHYTTKFGSYSLDHEILHLEPFLVMEKIPGQDLESLINDSSFRNNLEFNLLRLAKELLTILSQLHKPFQVQGQPAYFIYQDLKPANILWSPEDCFTLIDWGAVTLHLDGKTTEPTAGSITTGYAAPEAEDRPAFIDHRFDLYTLGATLWHIATRRDPRELPSPFPDLSFEHSIDLSLSKPFVSIIQRALAPLPNRYASAQEMQHDIVSLLENHVIELTQRSQATHSLQL